MVDLPHGNSPRAVALWAMRKYRRQLPGGSEALDLPEDLLNLPARPAKPIRRAVPGDRIDPPLSTPGCLQAMCGLLQGLWPSRAPGDVTESLRPFGDDQAVMKPFTPATEID